MPSCSIICIKIHKQTWSIPHWISSSVLQIYKTYLYCLVSQVSSISICLLGLSFFHLWPEIRQVLSFSFGMSMAKASFRKGEELIKLAIQERSVYFHFSDLQHLLIILLVPFLILRIVPLHSEDIWTFWISVWLYVVYVFSFKRRQIPILLLVFILRGLVKFLLWMESFFPSKVKLLEILLETSVWHLFYPGKQPAPAGLRDLFN